MSMHVGCDERLFFFLAFFFFFLDSIDHLLRRCSPARLEGPFLSLLSLVVAVVVSPKDNYRWVNCLKK